MFSDSTELAHLKRILRALLISLGQAGRITLVPKPSNHNKGLNEKPLTLELMCMSTALDVNAKEGDNRGTVQL